MKYILTNNTNLAIFMMLATKESNALLVQNFMLQKNYLVLLGKAFLLSIGNFVWFVKET